MNKMTKLAAAITVFASAGAMAATNPLLPTVSQSTGDIIVTVDKGHAMQISELDDVYLGVHQSSVTLAQVDEAICVYGTNAAGYTVQADSANQGGLFAGFRMQNGGFFVDYFVNWTDSSGTSGLLEGFASAVHTGNDLNLNCGAVGNTNTTISINVEPTTFDAAPTALYTDTLTLLVVSQ